MLSRAPVAVSADLPPAPGPPARPTVGLPNAAAAKPRRPIEAAVVCTIVIIVPAGSLR
ncbi:hypothetical protein Pmi06nite_73460 [Planotetraspora mira]|uniref:Uncharacterized protein n=1 Tax=Planotetraspora mira TaxID=58121 RepID=A0A8J3XB65_9ACTN|nr:hypothetical protein Pmi06nite_73460 [Planotetraspora mira]